MCDFEKANDSIPAQRMRNADFRPEKAPKSLASDRLRSFALFLLLAPCGCFLTVSIVVRRVV
jgi:hypothetical protein